LNCHGGEPPPFAPEGLVFESGAGFARLAVADVAEPLWNLLRWIAENPPPAIDPDFRADWEALRTHIDGVSRLDVEDFEAAAVAEELLARVRDSFAQVGSQDLVAEVMPEGHPFVIAFSPAVAMFGGLTPNLSESDIFALRDLLVQMVGGSDSASLAQFVEDRHTRPVGRVLHEDGYSFAVDLLDDLADAFGDCAPEGYIDIRGVCLWLESTSVKRRLIQTACVVWRSPGKVLAR
jgi:hypothetical protein